MNEPQKITLSYLKEIYVKGLRIPEIQRDYVMGAGGTDRDGKDKLEKLLDAILEKCQADEDFDFSCVITYCKDKDPKNEPLDIYDGQQRLTTLMLMTLYKLRSESEKKEVKHFEVKHFNEWYRFTGRTKANEILDLLTNDQLSDQLSIDNIEVTDFSSFSMKNLLKKIELQKYKDITSEYLLKRVKFNMVSIGSQSEIEQFFMDLNSGLQLKDYELYKPKLSHKVNQMKRNVKLSKDNIEALEMWSYKMDNEWLNFFSIFADFKHPAEEYEIAFIKYCIDMIFIENGETPVNGKIEDIKLDMIIRLYDIMQNITGLQLNFFKYKEEKLLKKGILYFSWGEFDSDNIKKHNYNLRGSFWNLSFEEYDRMLYFIIKFILLDAEKSAKMKNDVLLWCFITTLNWHIDVQNEYLRLIKIILNHNMVENKTAYYECKAKGQYLYYCKYCVYAIPQYYGEHLDIEVQDNKNRHSNMFLLNKSFIQNINISNMVNREKISHILMERVKNISKEKEFIKSIIDERFESMSESAYKNTYGDYVKKENAVFGIVSKMSKIKKNNDGEYDLDYKEYYLECVNLEWPIIGTREKSKETCLVRLKCMTDFIFAESSSNDYHHSIVKKTISKVKNDVKDVEDFIDKCFWTPPNNPYLVRKLLDRVTEKTTTYNKKYSDSGWCEEWSLN